MTQRTIDDVPQHLKDKYQPKLVEAFRKAAKLEAKISQNPDNLSVLDMAAATRLAFKFIKVAKDIKKAGGSDEDLELIMDKAMEESGFNPAP
jgi:hypothetical protein